MSLRIGRVAGVPWRPWAMGVLRVAGPGRWPSLALVAGLLAWQAALPGVVLSAGALLLLAQCPHLLRQPLLAPNLVDAALCLPLLSLSA